MVDAFSDRATVAAVVARFSIGFESNGVVERSVDVSNVDAPAVVAARRSVVLALVDWFDSEQTAEFLRNRGELSLAVFGAYGALRASCRSK